MKGTDIIIEISGGNVVSVTSNKDISYLIVDWDNISQGDEFPNGDLLSNQDGYFENIEDGLDKIKKSQ